VVFLHPDLGIGGAERLVVDAAVALKTKGHSVRILTAHHDPAHCFEETRDGTLEVTCVGDWLPRSFFGYCYALCAYVRMIYAALYLVFVASDDLACDVVFCDQVSACIPFLKVGPNRPDKIVFYCHFPDQLLTERTTALKKLYRAPLDKFEEVTTGMADVVLVNSKFTGSVFSQTFAGLKVTPDVLYPSLETEIFDLHEAQKGCAKDYSSSSTFNFLSVNRYSRKKNLPLAVEAFAQLKKKLQQQSEISIAKRPPRLIMIGGYDSRVDENVEHLRELQDLVSDLGLEDDVTFKTSTPSSEKVELMMNGCHALLYTPSGEHFGIVPLESMYAQLPVIAVDDAGPKESIANDVTGFLCPPEAEAFAEAMLKLVNGGEELNRQMGEAGRQRVKSMFSFDSFANQLNNTVTS